MWCCTGGTGIICQSFDTTHYSEKHNMVIEKRDRALLVKLFYLNGSKSSAALREYRHMKGLRRGPMSTNGLKKKKVMMMMKFENTGDLGVAPGRGRRLIPAVAVTDRASNSANNPRAVSRKLGVLWSTV